MRKTFKISIPSRTLLIGDPCYVKDEYSKEDWGLLDSHDFREKNKPKQLYYKVGHEGLGVLVPTNTNEAKVVINKQDEEDWGIRVASIDIFLTENENFNDESEIIGEIGVDSGQCMIFDAGTVQKEWVTEEEQTIKGIEFWGRDGQEIARILKEKYPITEKSNSRCYYMGNADLLQSFIKDLQQLIESGLWVVTSNYYDSSYNRACNVYEDLFTLNNKSFVEGINSSTGFGDGAYTVLGYFNENKELTGIQVQFL